MISRYSLIKGYWSLWEQRPQVVALCDGIPVQTLQREAAGAVMNMAMRHDIQKGAWGSGTESEDHQQLAASFLGDRSTSALGTRILHLTITIPSRPPNNFSKFSVSEDPQPPRPANP